MNVNFIKHSRSVIYNWILSYFLIILVTVILTGFVYIIAKNTIESEINNSNGLVLENIRDNIDGTLGEVNRFSMEISTDQNIRDAYNLTQVDNTNYYTIYKAANSLSNYKIFSNLLQTYYIFLNNLQLVVSSGTVNTGELYYINYINSNELTYDQWINTMNGVHMGDYVAMPHHEAGSAERNYLTLIRSFPLTSRYNVSANIVITLNFDNLLNFGEGESSLLILDDKNNIMAQSDTKIKNTDISYKDMTKNQGVIAKYIGDKKVVISYITSKQNSWKYITVTPEYIFWQKAEFIRNVMACEIILCILLIGVLSIYFVRRNYNPVKEMISFIHDKLRPETVSYNNEFNYIRQVLDNTIEEKKKFEMQLDMQNVTLKTNFLISLLKGRDASMPVHELLTQYDISLGYSYFSVIAIYIENIDEEFWKADEKTNIDEYQLCKFVIKNVVEEILSRNSNCYMAEVDDIIACIINTGLQAAEFSKMIAEEIDEAKDFIFQNFKISLVFTVGDLHDSIEDIHDAYNEAVNAMEYSRVMERDKTVFYNDIAVKSGMHYYFPVEKEHKLSNFIKSGDYKAASNIIEDIFINDLVKNSTSMEIARFLMLNLVGTILKTIREIDDEADRSFFENIIPASQLMKCRTLMDMKDKMLQIVRNICDYKLNRHEDIDYKVRDAVKQIVNENYSNPNFSIGTISDIIGKSPNYISRIFKIQTGEGLLDYINSVRIENAKELLKNNRFTHELVAERVGFTNIRTFYRVFKKLEGVTPGKLMS